MALHDRLTAFCKARISSQFMETVYLEIGTPGRGKLARLAEGCLRGQRRVVTSERIVEVPFVLRELGALPPAATATVLDFGCVSSLVALQLASIGYSVTAVDLRDYPFEHPNLRFLKGNVLKMGFRNQFDACIALSTVEHCGLGYYDGAEEFGDDHAVIRGLYEALKPGGKLILTVPFGTRRITPLHRIYDRESLKELLTPFRCVRTQLFVSTDRKFWLPANGHDAPKSEPTIWGLPLGVACVVAEKTADFR